ncbi:hypothetical protein OH77DRAFT_1436773 [Trametes cingulata]|nr:hypothetical protein OH77DRAFT_1436773 [Trametes cingulata]
MTRASESAPLPPRRRGEGLEEGAHLAVHGLAGGESIRETRSAHSHAWEASFTYIFQQKEMDSIAVDPARAPRNPQEYAMRATRTKVGQPPPSADKWFLVEAFWATMTFRLTLADLTDSWLDVVDEWLRYPALNKRTWATYIASLLRPRLRRCDRPLITRDSESYREEADTVVLLLHIELEQFRFNLKMTKQSRKMSQEVRTKLADSADTKLGEARNRVREVTACVSRRGKQGVPEWLREESVRPTETILEECRPMERSLRYDMFYQEVSLDELTQVVKAFRPEFTHTGHLYKCLNGHTFFVGERGGAVERSFCPECGSAIGGSGHKLLSDSSRATQLEDVARWQGAMASPWRWGI